MIGCFAFFDNKNGEIFHYGNLTKMLENSLNCERIGNTCRMQPLGKKMGTKIKNSFKG